jgi:hypothetical protein
MCNEQSCPVGDIFCQDLLAVDAKIGKRAIAVELRHKLRPNLVVPGSILRSPPVSKPAMGVINIAEFIKAVSDFVGHSGARGAVIGGNIALPVEVRWLQDSCRKNSALGLNMITAPGVCGLIGHSIGLTCSFNFLRFRARKKASARRIFPKASPRTISNVEQSIHRSGYPTPISRASSLAKRLSAGLR